MIFHPSFYREERQSIAASLVGRQAPLGDQGRGLAELRTETSQNNDEPRMRQQVVGRVSTETVYENMDGDADAYVDSDDFIEGRDDVVHRQVAPRLCIINGVRRRNVHLGGFGPDENDPSSRFPTVRHGYSSFIALSQALTEEVRRTPHWRMIDVVREYNETSQFMESATNERDRSFYASALELLSNELSTMAAGGTPESDIGIGGIN